MSVTPVGTSVDPATSMYAGTTVSSPKKSLDQEAFLQLLIAQMRNQDPTAPMDTTQMMQQSTQMASMEQLTALADTTRDSFALQMRIAASGLVGQQVSYIDAEGVTQTGIATAVSFAGPVPTVKVGDVEVPLDSVSAVATAPVGPPAAPPATPPTAPPTAPPAAQPDPASAWQGAALAPTSAAAGDEA